MSPFPHREAGRARRSAAFGSVVGRARCRAAWFSSVSNAIFFLSAAAAIAANTHPPNKVPGLIIDHSPAASGLYIGSPSIVILTNGDYVASHDFFGPKSGEHECATTVVFRSQDRGNTWKKVSEIYGAFWSSLFVHGGALYLLGPNRHHGDIYIRRSIDSGENWTLATNAQTGVLRDDGQYHCGPMPVVEHDHRLWRAFERRDPPEGWGTTYGAGMLSISVDADLLNATNWTSSNFLPNDRSWNGGDMGGWLEGNAVVARDGRVFDILRVETRSCPEKAAIVSISAEGKAASFQPLSGFINFPGGAKKFAIRYDIKSDRYWSLTTIVAEQDKKAGRPAGIRNTLALTSASELTNWTVRCILLHHPDTVKHGFQYADWQFDGDDVIAAVRTAFDDDPGGAHSAHDANYLTFHRWKNFRQLRMADSVSEAE